MMKYEVDYLLVTGERIQDLYIKLMFVCKRETTPEWGFDEKQIGYHNIIYIYEGKGYFGCNGGGRYVKKGDLVFMPRGCDRWLKTDPQNLLKLYTANFRAVLPQEKDGEWSAEQAEFLFEFVKTVEDEAARARFEVLFERLCILYTAGKDVQKIKQRAALAEILELSELCRKNQNVSYSNRNIVNESAKFMAMNYAKKLTLGDLAKEVGLSTSYYSAIFRASTGKSPIEYLIQLRIFKAKQLLKDGFSVTRTAEAVGFSDIYYFSNMFKKTEGISPTEYVKRGI